MRETKAKLQEIRLKFGSFGAIYSKMYGMLNVPKFRIQINLKFWVQLTTDSSYFKVFKSFCGTIPTLKQDQTPATVIMCKYMK